MYSGFGTIITNSTPSGALIYIDGNPIITEIGQIAITPSTIIDIPEGEHSITLKMIGYIDEYRLLNIDPGTYIPIDISLYPDLSYQDNYNYQNQNQYQDNYQNLQPSPGWPALPIPQIPYGHIVANTIPDGADIYIDGQPVPAPGGGLATTPSSIIDIPVGIHKVTFRKQGYFDENVEVLIQNGLYSDVSAVLRLPTSSVAAPGSFHSPVAALTPILSQYGISFIEPVERGLVLFESQPPGARIYVDARLLTDPDTGTPIKTPANVLLSVGRRYFQLELDGYEPLYGHVDVFPDSKIHIFRNFEFEIHTHQNPYHYIANAEGLGDIFIDSSPRGAYIYIDGIALVNQYNNPILTPARVTGVMEGMHEVQISLDQYYSKKLIVNVIPDRLNIAYGKLVDFARL